MNYIFDFGGTLVGTRKTHEEIFEDYRIKIANTINVPIEKVKIAQELMDKQNPDIFSFESRIKMTNLELEKQAHFEWFAGIIERLGVNVKLHSKLIEDLCEMSMTRIERYLYEDTLSCLAQLKKNNHRLYILSNGLPSRRLEIQNIGLSDYFDKIYVSSEISLEKPAKEIYWYVLNDLGLDPKDTTFIDDQIDCVEGANMVGMNVFRIVRNDHEIATKWDTKTLLSI